MVIYKCIHCGKQTSHKSLEKRFICIACGYKIFFKPRKKLAKIKAV